jgi:glycosyltransferase involved in cell wall biosynthesis
VLVYGISMVRNEADIIRLNLLYQKALGIDRILVVDNGSTDGTVEALKGYDNVTVLRSEVSFRRYQLQMRQYLIERFGRQRWSLLVDADELFDYPFSEVVGNGNGTVDGGNGTGDACLTDPGDVRLDCP